MYDWFKIRIIGISFLASLMFLFTITFYANDLDKRYVIAVNTTSSASYLDNASAIINSARVVELPDSTFLASVRNVTNISGTLNEINIAVVMQYKQSMDELLAHGNDSHGIKVEIHDQNKDTIHAFDPTSNESNVLYELSQIVKSPAKISSNNCQLQLRLTVLSQELILHSEIHNHIYWHKYCT